MHRSGRLALVLLGAGFAAACSEATPTGVPSAAEAPSRVVSGQMCEVVGFNEFAHGDAITSVSALGMTLTVSAAPGPLPWSGTNTSTAPRAWDTDANPADWEDKDLLWKPGGLCPGCSGLGRVMIIEDERGFTWWGDSRYGGEITISGFSGAGLSVKSFKAVDDDSEEPDIRLVVGADTVGRSSGLGNGRVETVTTTPHAISGSIKFVFGTKEKDPVLGSGGIDDVEICRTVQEETGGEGCTLGYWKQQHHFDSWVGYTPSTKLNTVFSFAGDASRFASLGNDTMLQALGYEGGGGALAAARLLLKQAVPALLNAASGDVDYAITTADIVAQVNAALADGNRNTMLALKDQLDRWNNAGCPLN